MPDRLYLLKPGFHAHHKGPWFCAECAVVEGMLSFYPQLRQTLDIRYVDFQRPRPLIVGELGAEHQSSPVLVMDKRPAQVPSTVTVKESKGKHFIDDCYQICDYLAAKNLVGMPHVPGRDG